MKLKEFMEMLKEAAAYTKEREDTEAPHCGGMGAGFPSSYGNCISCQLSLTAEGEVSQSPTPITVSFTVRA